MPEPEWIDIEAIRALQGRTIALHGGSPGLRDPGLLESALERPRNRFAYEGVEDIPALAATYAVALASNHPFIDGNKRAAFACLLLFLRLNGLALKADRVEATRVMVSVAAGEMNIEPLADWVRAHAVAV